MSHCCSSGCRCSPKHHKHHPPRHHISTADKIATGAVVGGIVGTLVGTAVHNAIKQSKKEKNRVIPPSPVGPPPPYTLHQPNVPPPPPPSFQHSGAPPISQYNPPPPIYPDLPQQPYHKNPGLQYGVEVPVYNAGHCGCGSGQARCYPKPPRHGLPPCRHGYLIHGCQHCEGWKWN
ncbi:extensin-like isoform X2 [Sitophilus oryzae]|uniref:Extensin-like isoform X2 n=1 Tax=Sitophilus oryzae TaxID=7048 RepID=A0A6J2XKQ2_SITOR|nr:extensin-like isoform X2 [Sitophilus oryzae]